jgi:hypothetical protein
MMQHPNGAASASTPEEGGAAEEADSVDEHEHGVEGEAEPVMKTCPHVHGLSVDVVKNTLLDPSLWSCRGSSTASHHHPAQHYNLCGAALGSIKLIESFTFLASLPPL